MTENIVLLYAIGDTVYIVEHCDIYDKKSKSYPTVYGNTVKITPIVVEALLITDKGVSIAENSWDGYYPLETQHDLCPVQNHPCKIFFTEDAAREYVNTISVQQFIL